MSAIPSSSWRDNWREAIGKISANSASHIALIAALGVVTLVVGAAGLEWLARTLIAGETPADYAKATGDARTFLTQLLGGGALVAGVVFTARTYSLTSRTQRADRFSKAIERNADDKISSRCGGIWALALIAQEDETYWASIEQVLCAYVREHSQRIGPQDKIYEDIQVAVGILGSRGDRANSRWPALDLRGAKLDSCKMVGLDLSRATFTGGCVRSGDFTDSKLVGCNFDECDLDEARLTNAQLRGSTFRNTSMKQAEFLGARMERVELRGADVTGALNLSEEQLSAVASRP